MKNILFIGTNYFASSILNKLIENKIQIKNIITKNDSYFGRGRNLKSYPVKIVAQKNNISLYTIDSINAKEIKNIINKINPSIIIVIEYGEKIDNEIINIPKYGVINLHPSLLPKFRGALPIEYAIINDEKKTGISIIQINSNMDGGNILNVEECILNRKETYISLSKKLINIGYKCLISTLVQLKNNKIKSHIQNNKEASYTKKFASDFFYINWNNNALLIDRKVRALCGIKKFCTRNKTVIFKIIKTTVLKKTHTYVCGQIINITKHGIDVNTKKYILRIKTLQFPGKNVNTIKNLLNSNKIYFKIGDILT